MPIYNLSGDPAINTPEEGFKVNIACQKVMQVLQGCSALTIMSTLTTILVRSAEEAPTLRKEMADGLRKVAHLIEGV